MSSFKRNSKNSNLTIDSTASCPIGYHPSHYDGIPIASTGIASLDDLIGGGLPIRSSLLILEDEDGAYAKLMLRYSIAQGIVSNQHLIVVGSSVDEGGAPDSIIQRLMALDESLEIDPTSLPDDSSSSSITHPPSNPPALANPLDDGQDDEAKLNTNLERMKIAWRYENLGQHGAQSESHLSHQSRCHSFNLAKTMKLSSTQKSKVHCIDTKDFKNVSSDLLDQIRSIIDQNRTQSSSFRIVIQSIGSLGWPPIQPFMIFRFLKELDALLRTTEAVKVAMISLPSLYRSSELSKMLPWATTGSLSLKSFAGDERSQAAFPNHQGAVHFLRLPSPSSLSPPATKLSTIRALGGATSGAGIDSNLGFKLGRKKGFQIEMMGLGLDLNFEDIPQEGSSIPPDHRHQSEIDRLEAASSIFTTPLDEPKKPSTTKTKPRVRFGPPSQSPSESLSKTDW